MEQNKNDGALLRNKSSILFVANNDLWPWFPVLKIDSLYLQRALCIWLNLGKEIPNPEK